MYKFVNRETFFYLHGIYMVKGLEPGQKLHFSKLALRDSPPEFAGPRRSITDFKLASPF